MSDYEDGLRRGGEIMREETDKQNVIDGVVTKDHHANMVSVLLCLGMISTLVAFLLGLYLGTDMYK